MEILAFILLAFFLKCEGRLDGAPTSACSTLTPRHSGIPPQRSAAPYSVTFTKKGDKIEVTLSSEKEPFQGFVLQPRYRRDRSKIVDGRFTTKSGVTKTIDCNGTENTLTMVNPSPKDNVVTEWTPSTSLDEEVIFRATFAETFDMFWTEVDSRPVKIVSDGNSGSGESQKEKRNSVDKTYVGCSVSKGCFGIPSGCITKEDCQVFLTYAKTKDGEISFTMYGTLDTNEYMAMGLSTDKQMGDDSVTECIRKGSTIVASRSWNNGKKNQFLHTLEMEEYQKGFVDGMTTCSFKLSNITETNERIFNLANSTYYTLLAKGPLNNERLSYHQLRDSTEDPVNFNAFEVQEGAGVDPAIKVHGTFMVTAWVGFVSLGILLARHFKASWESRTICGVKIWFALHRLLMLSSLGFIVVAFIVIFVHKKGWNETDNPHAALGCTATALGLLQPVMALFRPGPDHPKRPIFNWLHFVVGNGAQLIAVLAIFYAKTLEASRLNNSFYEVMAVFVIVYLLIHLFFQVHTWSSERKKNNEVKMIDLASRGGNIAQNGVPEKNLVNQAIRQIFLGIYTIFVVAILIALYGLIGAA